ncbi:acyl-CoA dehydrogenase family protein [Cupriavidus basilensis]
MSSSAAASAAHLFSEIEITRAAVLRSQQLARRKPAQPVALVSAAKARAGNTATLAVQEGVQMHGGIGMTDEFEIGFYMEARLRRADTARRHRTSTRIRWGRAARLLRAPPAAPS